MLPSTGLSKVMGNPMILSRLAKAMDAPRLSVLMSPVSVSLWLMRMMAGVALCVRTMKGEKVVVPPPLVLIVVPAALVPHQTSVALMLVPPFLRLFPTPVAELPARRLKVMVSGPAALGKVPALPFEIPPPGPDEGLSTAELFWMVLLVMVTNPLLL